MMMATNVVELQKTETAVPTRVEMVRVIKAKRERVFDAFTRPEMIRQWFGPGDRAVEEVKSELHVEGAYQIAMGPGGENTPVEHRAPSSVKGCYTKVEPHHLLQFTWCGSWRADEESLVTITLKDVEGGTELRLVHEGLVQEGSLAGHTYGWTVALKRMEEFFEEKD
jgi:uncharacterized protein YndB with AHSA1/START domain